MTVYIVLVTGFAITTGPVEIFRPADGDQIKLVAPLAVNITLLPWQIEVSDGLTDMVRPLVIVI